MLKRIRGWLDFYVKLCGVTERLGYSGLTVICWISGIITKSENGVHSEKNNAFKGWGAPL